MVVSVVRGRIAFDSVPCERERMRRAESCAKQHGQYMTSERDGGVTYQPSKVPSP